MNTEQEPQAQRQVTKEEDAVLRRAVLRSSKIVHPAPQAQAAEPDQLRQHQLEIQRDHWQDRCVEMSQAISKKDAALDACVEAHTKLRAAFHAFHATQKSGDVIEMGKSLADIADAEAELNAAITQAKEARK